MSDTPNVEVVTTPTTVEVTVETTDAAIVTVKAHTQAITHRYTIRFPAHVPRDGDPHYGAFEAFKKKMHGTPAWQCAIGARFNDFSACTLDKPLEIHHRVIEFAVQNEVDLAALELDYPSIQTEEELAAFVESDSNFQILCQNHHRGHAGAHTVAHADWVAEMYVKGLIS